MITDNSILDVVKNTVNTNNKVSIADVLIDRFYEELISKHDKELLKLAFSRNPTQADLNDFLTKWDIEVAGGNKALILSYFMKEHTDLKCTDYEQPRLEGLLRFYRFHNLKLIAHFTKIGQELNKKNIEVMLLKGGAMKFLRPNLSRHMGDIDILVPAKDYTKAGETATSLGYDCSWDVHSVDLHQNGSEEGILDIHKYIFMDTGFEEKLNKGLFDRAKRAKVFGVDALVPCHEDMFFIALVNMARNLRNNTSSAGMLFTLFDCKFLLEDKPDFDWDIVIKNTKITKTEVQMGFVVQFINKIIPNLLPEQLRNNKQLKKETDNYCNIVMYNRFSIYDMKMRCRELKLKDAISNFATFKEYITLKPKYFLLKQIRRNPLAIKAFYKVTKKNKIEI